MLGTARLNHGGLPTRETRVQLPPTPPTLTSLRTTPRASRATQALGRAPSREGVRERSHGRAVPHLVEAAKEECVERAGAAEEGAHGSSREGGARKEPPQGLPSTRACLIWRLARVSGSRVAKG